MGYLPHNKIEPYSTTATPTYHDHPAQLPHPPYSHTDYQDPGGVGQDHVQQLLLTLHLFHYGVFHREKKHMVATNAFIF